jgi:hypothetical protein
LPFSVTVIHKPWHLASWDAPGSAKKLWSVGVGQLLDQGAAELLGAGFCTQTTEGQNLACKHGQLTALSAVQSQPRQKRNLWEGCCLFLFLLRLDPINYQYLS